MIKTNCPKVAKNLFILLIVSLVFVISFSKLSSYVYALTSENINFQGKIVRNDTGHEGLNVIPGTPACVVDGAGNDTCDFQVAYYTASTGGTLLLTETFSNVEIGQYDGVFELSLGAGTVYTPKASQCGAARNESCDSVMEVISEYKDLYIELKFSPDGTNLTETFNRMPLEASGYSIFSKYAEGAKDAFKLSTSLGYEGTNTPTTGMVYYNTTTSQLTVYNGSSWDGIKSSLWTDAGTFTYLTSTTDDLVLGASTGGADGIFYFDMNASDGSYFDVNDTSSNRLFTILSGGNVGIGTATPGAKLEVAGSASTITNASGDLTISTGGLNGNILLSPHGTGSVRANSPFGIRETGTTPTFYTYFVGGDQTADVTYTLPTADGTVSGQVLTTNASGVLSWTTVATGAPRWNEILAPNGNLSLAHAGYTTSFTFDSITTESAYSMSSSSLTTGNVLGLSTSSTALTTGGLLSISATGAPAAAWSGSLAKIEYDNADADVDGSALQLGLLGTTALGSGTVLNITTSQEGTGALALRVNDDGTYTDTTPFVIDRAGKVGIGIVAPSAQLHSYVTSDSQVNTILEVPYPVNALWQTSTRSALIVKDNFSGASLSVSTTSDVGMLQGFEGSSARNITLNPYGGSVGVGTTSPSGRLHSYISNSAVTTSQYVGYFENLATNITTDTINKYGIYITSTGDFSGSTGTATNNYGLYVDTPTGGDNNYAAIFEGGNVGIGTASPSTALHVTGIIRQDDSYGVAARGMNAGYFSSTTNLTLSAGNTTGSIILNAGPSERARIDGATGYVGIGEASPASLFTVGSGDLFQVDSTGDMVKIKNVTYSWPSANAVGMLTNNGSGTLSWTNLNAGDELLPTGTEGQMLYNNAGVWTSHSGTYWDDTNSRLGVGVTSPSGKLHTYTSNSAVTATQYTGYFENLATNTTTDAIDKYGMYITSTGTYTGLTGTATNNYGLYVDTPTGGDNNYAAIFEGGNVGIGIANPSNKLVVTGSTAQGVPSAVVHGTWNGLTISIEQNNSSAYPFIIKNLATTPNTGNTIFSVDGAGIGYFSYRVGIGTSSPEYRLQVNGEIVPEATDQDLGTTSLRWDVYANAVDADAASTFTGGATVRGLTVDNATATDDRILTSITTGGTARFDGTITNSDLTAARTWTLPNATGTIALTSDIPAGATYWTRSGTELYPTTSGDSVRPNGTATLGTDTNRWADIYLSSSSIHIGSSTTDEGVISYDTTNNILGFNTDTTTNGDISFFTDDLYLDKSVGRVGIGITTPGYILDVAGSVRLGATGVDNTIYIPGSGATRTIYTSGDGLLTNGSFSASGDIKTSTQIKTSTVSSRDNGKAAIYIAEGSGNTFATIGIGTSAVSASYQTIISNASTQTGLVTLVLKGITSQTGDLFRWIDSSNNVLGVIDASGDVGIGVASPTAVLHLKAGTAAANTAPLKFTTGVNLTTAESGAMEWDGSRLYITNTTPTRNTIAYTSDIPAGATYWSRGTGYLYPTTAGDDVLPDANNSADLGASGTRWNYMYGTYGNFANSVAVGDVGGSISIGTLGNNGSNNLRINRFTFSTDVVGTSGMLAIYYDDTSDILFANLPNTVSRGLVLYPSTVTTTTSAGIELSTAKTLGNSSGILLSTTQNITSSTANAGGLDVNNTISFDPTNNLVGSVMSGVRINQSFAPNTTNKNINYNGLLFTSTINQTGGANATTRGVYINPTLTSAADFRAIDIANNSSSSFGIYQSGSNTLNYFAGKVGIGTSSPDYALQVNGVIAPETDTQDLGTSALSWDLYANAIYDSDGDIGTNGQVLSSTATGTNWIAAGGSGTVTNIATGVGLTGGPITTTGTISFSYSETLATDTLSANQTVFGSTGIIFEGATANTYETLLTVTDPTADRTITLPNATGTVALTSDLSGFISQAYTTIQEEGTGLTQRSILNFVGSGFTAADDTTRTNVTLDTDLNTFASLASSTGVLTNNGSGTLSWVNLNAGDELLPTGTEGQMLYSNAGVWTAYSGMYWDDVNNRLGIGTTAPNQKLEVNTGTILAKGPQATGTVADYITSGGTNSNKVFSTTGTTAVLGYNMYSSGTTDYTPTLITPIIGGNYGTVGITGFAASAHTGGTVPIGVYGYAIHKGDFAAGGLFTAESYSGAVEAMTLYGIYNYANSGNSTISGNSVYGSYNRANGISGDSTYGGYFTASGGTTNYGIYSAAGNNYFASNVGIGDSSPASLLTVGSGDVFQVNSSGDIVKIKNLTYSWPSSHGAGLLKDDGSGNLTWDTSAYITGLRWDQIADPNTSKTFTMAGNQTGFTFNSISTVAAYSISSTSLTSGILLDLSSTTTLTSGSVLKVSNTATTGLTGNVADFSGSLTTGSGSIIGITANAINGTGSGLKVTTSTTGALTNGLVYVSGSAAHTGNLVNVTTATATGVGLNVTANSLTSGNGLKVSSTATTGLTGNVADFSGSLTTGSGSIVGITANAINGTGSGLKVTTSTTGALTNGLVYVNGSAAHTGNLVNVTTATATGVGLNVTSNSLTSGNGLKVSSTATTGLTGNVADFSGSLTTGSGSIVGITANAINGTGSGLKVTTSTTGALTNGLVYVNGSAAHTGNLVNVTTATATGVGLNVAGNSITTGTVSNLSSTSTAGGASGSSYVLNISRSGANTNLAHTAYGIYSNVTNTNVTSGTNIAGYFSASGATTANYGILVGGTATNDKIGVSIANLGATSYIGTITNADLTAARTWTLPDVGGTIPLGTGTANYVAFWSGTNTLGSEQYLATSRGGLGANVTAAGAGELLYSTAATTYDSLVAGTSGQILKSGGAGAPTWNTAGALTKTDDTNVTLTLGGSATTALVNAASITVGWSGTLAATRGGTGLGTYTTGDILYASAANTLSARAIGTTGQVLTVVSGVPQWATPASGSLWTDGGVITYLTATGDDLAVGGSTSGSPFFVDVSANMVRIGTGATASAVLNMYASDGDTGSITYTTSDAWEFNGGNVGIGVSSPSALLHLDAGTETAGTAPLKFSAGTNLTTAESGAMEWDGSRLYITDTTLSRNTIAYTSDLSGLITGVKWNEIQAPEDDLSIAHGAYTTNFSFDSVTTLTAFAMSSSSLTSGKILGVSSSATGMTGSLVKISLTDTTGNAANTGKLLEIANEGVANTGTSVLINHYATGTGNLAFRVNDEDTDTTPFVITGTGNVGIGDSGPTNKLVVNNNISTKSTIELQYNGTPVVDIFSNVSSNIFMGLDSGQAITTGTGNVAYGFNSLYANTTGVNNVAIGHQALSTNVARQGSTALGYQAMMYADSTVTAGLSYNTAVGYQALTGSGSAASNTGTANTAIGHQVLTGNTTGSYNVGVGANVLNANTTGTQNIAIGYNALFSNVAKSGSVAIGYEAMRYANSSATGSAVNNIALGYQALRGSATPANNIGTNNIAIGSQAMYSVTSGSKNVALGETALYSSQTAADNVALGYGALYNATGDGNIAIGYQAGDLASFTGSNNIIIGYNIDMPATTSSNMLNIGNLIYGTGLDGSGQTLSSGNVGIGTNAPSTLLQLGTPGSRGGVLSLAGATSGLVTIDTLATAGTWTLTLPGNDGDANQALITDGSGNTSWTGIPLGTGSGSATAGQVTFWNGTSSITGNNNFWWDNSNVRLGIGTSSPTATLDIGGASSRIANSSGDITIDPAGNLIIASGSYVGIGTASPAAILDVAGVTSEIANSLGDMTINPEEDLIITSKVGIGTSGTFDAKLAVIGLGSTSSTTNTELMNSSSTSLFKVLDDGKISFSSNVEFSKDGTNWVAFGGTTNTVILSAEYSGAVLSADGTDNVGSMTSDSESSTANAMNYYEWNSSVGSLNDYDVRVRFQLPSDFDGWGSGGVQFYYATESTSSASNKADFYIYEQSSGTPDGSSTAKVSSSAGVWTSTTIAGSGLTACVDSGDICVFVIRQYSSNDNYVRVGDIKITYNRSL